MAIGASFAGSIDERKAIKTLCADIGVSLCALQAHRRTFVDEIVQDGEALFYLEAFDVVSLINCAIGASCWTSNDLFGSWLSRST